MSAYTELQPANFRGEVDGRATGLYTLSNSRGMTVRFTTLGAKVMQIVVPDRHGEMDDVALGYETLEQVRQGVPSMGAFIGRFANRIAHGRFPLDGREHQVSREPGHVLHGGPRGSCRRVFDLLQHGTDWAALALHYEGLEDGFPGNVMSRVVYRVTDDNALSIEYDAVCDSPTVVNLTSHIFFNLAGQHHISADSLARHELMINSRSFTPVDHSQIPTGEIRSVDGTPMDFRLPQPIGSRLQQVCDGFEPRTGYDHNWVIDKAPGALTLAARVRDPLSGRVMEVFSTEPGLVFYGGNNLTGKEPRDVGKGRVRYEARSALCLEPARFPDSPNHPEFPSTVLRPGEWFSGKAIYRFSVD